MKRFGVLSGLLVAGLLVGATQLQAATVTTGVDSGTSRMGTTAHGCLQGLTTNVSEGENCMYDGGPSAYAPANPFGEATGPYS